MRTVENLLKATKNTKLGNHKKEFFQEGQKYSYYGTVICEVNHINHTVTLDKSYGTSSTTRAVNAYMRALQGAWITKDYQYIVIE